MAQGKHGADPLPPASRQVARVGRPHGVGGELRLIPESGEPRRLLELSTIWLRTAGGDVASFRVGGMRSHGGAALAALEGIADRDAAAAWTHAEAWALEAELPAWEEDEFSVDEVEGWAMVDGSETVGVIRGIATNAGRDYFEVERAGRVILVPAVKDWLIEKDSRGRRIVMRLPEGLVDA